MGAPGRANRGLLEQAVQRSAVLAALTDGGGVSGETAHRFRGCGLIEKLAGFFNALHPSAFFGTPLPVMDMGLGLYYPGIRQRNIGFGQEFPGELVGGFHGSLQSSSIAHVTDVTIA